MWKKCISALDKIKDKALKYYDNNIDNNIVGKVSDMLLLDGCFVVEFILDYYKDEVKEGMSSNWCG